MSRLVATLSLVALCLGPSVALADIASPRPVPNEPAPSPEPPPEPSPEPSPEPAPPPEVAAPTPEAKPDDAKSEEKAEAKSDEKGDAKADTKAEAKKSGNCSVAAEDDAMLGLAALCLLLSGVALRRRG